MKTKFGWFHVTFLLRKKTLKGIRIEGVLGHRVSQPKRLGPKYSKKEIEKEKVYPVFN